MPANVTWHLCNASSLMRESALDIRIMWERRRPEAQPPPEFNVLLKAKGPRR